MHPASLTLLQPGMLTLLFTLPPCHAVLCRALLCCRLEFSEAPGQDAMARRDDIDDYVVFDPLLEAAKGKFSQAAQREKRQQTKWAGRGQG